MLIAQAPYETSTNETLDSINAGRGVDHANHSDAAES